MSTCHFKILANITFVVQEIISFKYLYEEGIGDFDEPFLIFVSKQMPFAYKG